MLGAASAAGALSTPLQALPAGAPAPEWDIAEWINAPAMTLKEQRGKIVIIDFFQLWCPGCNSFSIPLTQKWERDFAAQIEADEMQIVSIHTVFEGHKHQNLTRLRSYVDEKGFGHPVGHDRHDIHPRLPNTMILYGTRGTPEMAVIDKEGDIAFQQFGYFDVPQVEGLIGRLLSA